MKTFNNRRYFTLDDIKKDLGILTQYSGPLAMNAAGEDVSHFFYAILEKCGCSNPIIIYSSEAIKMFQDYLWPNFYNQYICFTDDDSIADDDSEKVFADKIGTIIA